MKTWTFDEVRPPGVGPWNNEPDRAAWIDEATGYDCLIIRHPAHGCLNGYVAVPGGHPAYGLGYDAIHDRAEIDVHGGLTYASFGDTEEGNESILIRHPEPGRPTDVWWFGFDCHHAWDLAPTFEARLREVGAPLLHLSGPGMPEVTYKPFPYVVAECESLARQLAAMA